MYEYIDDITKAKPGDIVEYIKGRGERNGAGFKYGELYIVKSYSGNPGGHIYVEGPATDNQALNFKLVKTKPGSEAKVGDQVIRIDIPIIVNPALKQGEIVKVIKITSNDNLFFKNKGTYSSYRFLVLCETKEQLAFYKESGLPWTDKEAHNIQNHCNDDVCGAGSHFDRHYKWFFNDGTNRAYMFSWDRQEQNPNFKNCKQVSYESIFGTTNEKEYTVPLHEEGQSRGDDIRQIQKENTMNDIDIKLEVNGKKIPTKSSQPAKPKTDLEKKLPYAMVAYNANGNYNTIYYNKTKKGALKRKSEYLQHPNNLGHTVTIHKCIAEYTTAIPVVKVK